MQLKQAGWNGVLVHDSAGAIVSRIDDPSVPLDIDVPACGAVTLFTPTLYETTTLLAGGDALHESTSTGSSFATATIIVEAEVPNTFNYLASAGICGTGQGPSTIPSTIPLQFRTSCNTPTTVLVIPQEGLGGGPEIPFSFAVLENISLAAATQTPLRVTSWQTDAPQHDLSIQLAAASDINCGMNSRNGPHSYPGTAKRQMAVADHTFQIKFPEFGDSVGYDCFLETGELERSIRVRAPAPAPASVSFTEDQLLPIVENVTHDTAARPTVSWTVSPDTVEEDLVLTSVYGVSAAGFTHWRLIAPPGTRSIRAPELPPDLAIDFSDPDVGVSIFEASYLPGYREALRASTDLYIFRSNLPLGTNRVTTFGRGI